MPRRRAGRGRNRRGERERAGALTVHDAREAARPAVPKAPGAVADAGSAGGAKDDGRANANAGGKAASRGPRKGPSIKWTKEEVSPSQLRALPFKRSIFNGLPQAMVLALHRLFELHFNCRDFDGNPLREYPVTILMLCTEILCSILARIFISDLRAVC